MLLPARDLPVEVNQLSVVDQGKPIISETGSRVHAVAEWRSTLTAITGAWILFLTIGGFSIYFLPFSKFNQFNILVHTVVGLGLIVPVIWYTIRHWLVRKKGNLSHYQLLGYISVGLMAVCIVSGLVVTWQGAFGTKMSYAWDVVHLVSGAGMALFLIVHLATVIVRKVKNVEALSSLRSARRSFYLQSTIGCALLLLVCAAWSFVYEVPETSQGFAADYNWRFGHDRPFAPSLARIDSAEWNDQVHNRVVEVLGQPTATAYLASYEKIENEPSGLFDKVRRCLDELEIDSPRRQKIDSILESAAKDINNHGAVNANALAGSAGCGTSGCHQEIYDEWIPSAHRYSSMDDMFQRVQTLMVEETSPEQTRYCAGCHDPISLFSGAKDSSNMTLSAEGADEGSSCLVCHSIVQTDVQGNGDYTIKPPIRYVYEQNDHPLARFVSNFLIRTYPGHHMNSYSRSLYKTPEFCAACHKQYLDKEVNTDIGKVQGQNQYDSWMNSRWYHEDDPEKTLSCRECHMPLIASSDPSRGDPTDYNRSEEDGKHRSHRMLASNQYIPLIHNLPGAEKHVALIERWLKGDIEIPEIADKWTTGPVVRMAINAPQKVASGDDVSFRVVLTNNKTGHDFPTGPLDMIESWVEITVHDGAGNMVYQTGQLSDRGEVTDPQIIFKADGFDRQGKLIDRHNLWDLVGASYKRVMYPGVVDAVDVQFQCPSMARGRMMPQDGRRQPGQRIEGFGFSAPETNDADELTVTAILWYRKANPEFLDRVYGTEMAIRSPATEMTRATAAIRVVPDVPTATQ